VRGGDGASTDVPITPRDASDGRVSGLVLFALSWCKLKVVHLSYYQQFSFTKDPDVRFLSNRGIPLQFMTLTN